MRTTQDPYNPAEFDPTIITSAGRDVTTRPRRRARARGQCYDHNFLRFSAIFGGENLRSSQNQCCDRIFA
jgi:hypothetical protein